MGTLDIETLDVDSFLSQSDPEDAKKSEKKTDELFSSERFPFDRLEIANADLIANIGTGVLPKIRTLFSCCTCLTF